MNLTEYYSVSKTNYHDYCFRKTAKFVVVLIPLFGVIYILTVAIPIGQSIQLDIIYLYGEMFYNSFAVI